MSTVNEITVFRNDLKKCEVEFEHALPKHIPVERFMRVVLTAVQNNPDLLFKVNRKSLFNACMKAAQDGLLPDGREGAIVPYNAEAQWMPMIAGIRKKVRNSGEIATWDVSAVYANDHFEFELGDNPFIRHKPTLETPGKLIAVYSVATLKGGEKSRDVMSVAQVEKIRALSKGKNTPWNNPTFYDEMAKKTVARRHSKVLPVSTDLDDLLRRDDVLYDFDGASDKSVEGKKTGLANKLSALATPQIEHAQSVPASFDALSNTENLQEARQPEKLSEMAVAAREAKIDAPAKAEPEQEVLHTTEQLEEIMLAGVEAKEMGMSVKAMPSTYNDAAKAAWLDGYNAPLQTDGAV